MFCGKVKFNINRESYRFIMINQCCNNHFWFLLLFILWNCISLPLYHHHAILSKTLFNIRLVVLGNIQRTFCELLDCPEKLLFFSDKKFSNSSVPHEACWGKRMMLQPPNLTRECSMKKTEPSHEILALFVLRKLILQTCMCSHPVGLDFWFLVEPFVYFHTLCANSEGSGETRRLAWAFAGRLFANYDNLMSWLN